MSVVRCPVTLVTISIGTPARQGQRDPIHAKTVKVTYAGSAQANFSANVNLAPDIFLFVIACFITVFETSAGKNLVSPIRNVIGICSAHLSLFRKYVFPVPILTR